MCATSWFAALIAYSAEMSDRAVLKAQMSMLRSKSVKSRFLRGIDTVEARVRGEMTGDADRTPGCSLM